jgi:hypothetical protein
MDPQFEKLKQETERELGRAVDSDEEHTLKMLYYFGLGCKLKAEVDATSEPERIGPIAERVFREIETRGEGRRRRRAGVVQAMRSFFSGKKERPTSQKDRTARQ